MDMLRHLNDAVEYIERNLCDDVHMEGAARIAGISHDSFLRYFSYMTGMSVSEYVRRRRLTLAAYELRDSNARVIDIALKYGFNSADAFTKAFVRQHGVTPREARRTDCALKVYPPVAFHIMITGARQMDFRIMQTDEIRVRGISREFAMPASKRFDEEHAMWAASRDYVPGRISRAWQGVWYGIWDSGRYLLARSEADAPGEGLEQGVIPAGTYAAFTSQQGVSTGEELPRMRQMIFESLLPDSGYEPTGDREVEVCHLWDSSEERWQKEYCELWIPVRKAAAQAPDHRVPAWAAAQY